MSPLTPLWDQPRADQVWGEGEATPVPPVPPPPCPGGPSTPSGFRVGRVSVKWKEEKEFVRAEPPQTLLLRNQGVIGPPHPGSPPRNKGDRGGQNGTVEGS